jgi:hypothetical protein
MNPTLFVSETKRQLETISYFGDFRDVLLPGELIISQTVTVILYSGTDPNPSAMLYQGIVVHNQTVIEQRIRQGVVGNIYNIIFTVGTNQSNTYEKCTRLAILPNEGIAPTIHTVLWLTSDLYPYNYVADGMQGFINFTGGNNFWLQPSFSDPMKGSIIILSGNLFGGSHSYSYLDTMQGNVSIQSGILTQVVVPYTAVPDAMKGGVAIISGNLYQGSVPYTYQESMQGSITIVSGSLF